MEATQVPQAWQMYPSVSGDGLPGNVLYNSGLLNVGPQQDAPYLHLVGVLMAESTDDGLATEAEADWFHRFEEAVVPTAEQLGFFAVGRVASHGRWELSFYGPGTQNLVQVLEAVGTIGREREATVSVESDENWAYLSDYIAPDISSIAPQQLAA